jgi:primosomal protein N' (replication factor Y)
MESLQTSPWEPRARLLPLSGASRYAQVLVSVTARTLQSQIFTYQVPEEYQSLIRVGQPVLVPFGAQPELTGFVTALSEDYDGIHKLKDLTDILDETPLFDAAYYDFIQWVSDYYATSISQVLACALPANLVRKTKKTVLPGPHMMDRLVLSKVQNAHARQALALVDFLYRNSQPYEDWIDAKNPKGYSPKYLAIQLRTPLKLLNRLLTRLKTLGVVVMETEFKGKTAPKTIKTVTINPNPPDSVESVTLSKRQQEILDYLRARDTGMPLSQLLETMATTLPTVKKLEATHWLAIHETVEHRDPLGLLRRLQAHRTFTLSTSQQNALETVIHGDNEQPYLLYGVTGSGKTEVYMSLTRHAVEQGQSVLVMVPEIALTSQIARRFISHFGPENIALWHSNLSDGEKADTWKKLQNGELPILIGARSAIWAPMKNLGMILIDEEHEGSFKQDSPAPRYNAKTLALELARRTGAKVVLGSATPEISTFYEAQRNKRVLHLPERFGNSRLAEVRIADMKKERGEGNRNQISRLLEAELRANLEAQEQSIILLNRRGFYTTIQCTVCDYIFICTNCDVALTYHRVKNRVCCHYCGLEDQRPQFCPVCASMELNHTGVGTQRIEEEVLKKFPEARIIRLDSDVMQRKNAHLDIFETFSSGEADILIGTQIVAKGLDVANVTLVGVVSADAAFALPDFKSAERGFQLLTQVAGRAGRGQKAGRVVIQAVQTQHMVLRYAADQDYPAFYQEEVQQREALGFPPFSQIFRFIVSGENEARTQQYIQAAAAHLRQILVDANLDSQMTMMGPAPCVLPRIQNRYRFHLLVKNFAGPAGHRAITDFYRKAMDNRLPEELNFLLDIDAQSLL